jgi:hypothetical protein
MKMAFFWDAAPCSLVKVHQRFRGVAVSTIALIQATSTSETFVNFYQTTRRNIPENSYVPIYRREDL